MSAFVYKNNELYTSEVSISSIATKIGTPFYCYNANYIIQQFNFYKEAFANVPNYLIAYALKANSNQAIIKLLAKQGSGADIVSLGELHRAYKAGIPSSKIIFSGVGKSQEEIDAALMANIGCFNIESKAEFELLQTRAKELNKIAPISIRINPNIDAKTHPKIATGLASNKFGLEMSEAKALYALAAKTPELEILGVDVHIGSQICSLDPFDQAFALVAKFIAELQELNIYIKHVDIIAGFAYRPDNFGNNFFGILGAGAYGAVMASSYNSRLLIPEILVQNNQWYVICLLYTSPSPRDLSTSRMPSSA